MKLSEKFVMKCIQFDYRWKNLTLCGLERCLFSKSFPREVRRILIFRTGSMGDSICALPAIYAIRKRFPEAQLHILTNAGSTNLVSLGSLIDKSLVSEIIDYHGMNKVKLFQLLNAQKYDVFIQLPQYDATWGKLIRDMLIARLLGIRKAFGWMVSSTRFLPRWQEKYMTFHPEETRLLNLLQQYGIQSSGYVYPLGINDSIKNKIATVIKSQNLQEQERNIGLVVGAKRKQNQWPISYFEEITNELLKKGFKILLFGGKEDEKKATRLKGENIQNYVGKLTPLETAEMMKYCQLIVSPDTGPMHLAYAVGIPVIAIFSGRDYKGKWYPPAYAQHHVFRGYTHCWKCFESPQNCDCLHQVLPKMVLQEILKRTTTCASHTS